MGRDYTIEKEYIGRDYRKKDYIGKRLHRK